MSEKNVKTRHGTDNENAMRINAKGHIRFNIVDFFVILVVLLVAAASVMYFLPGVMEKFSSDGSVEITYVLEFRGVDDIFIANIQGGDKVFDAGQNFNMGNVISVETESYKTLEYDSLIGEAVMKEHIGKKTLIITVTASAIYTEGEGYSINGERISVGGIYDIRFPNYSGKAYCTAIKLSSK